MVEIWKKYGSGRCILSPNIMGTSMGGGLSLRLRAGVPSRAESGDTDTGESGPGGGGGGGVGGGGEPTTYSKVRGGRFRMRSVGIEKPKPRLADSLTKTGGGGGGAAHVQLVEVKYLRYLAMVFKYNGWQSVWVAPSILVGA